MQAARESLQRLGRCSYVVEYALKNATPSTWTGRLSVSSLFVPASFPGQHCMQHGNQFCDRQLFTLSASLQSRFANSLTGLRKLSSAAPKGSGAASDSKVESLMAQRLGKKAGDQFMYAAAIAIAMVGATYGAVPLYRMFCQATGYGGTVQEGSTVEAKLKARKEAEDAALEAACAARELTVFFSADVHDNLQWKFTPTQRSVKIHPGQSTLAFYTAQNMSDKAITGVSTYNVTPMSAGPYFNKIQCFCFEEQKLQPGEKIDMPVFFYVDPEFATDVRLSNISNLTLSYTFFKVLEEDAEIVVGASNLA